MSKAITISMTLLISAAFFACGGQSLDKSEYAAKNAAILSSLPVLPGSKIIETFVEEYDEDGGNSQTIGYTTTRAYESTQNKKDIVLFYRRELIKRGWRVAEGFDLFYLDMRKGANHFHVLAEDELAIVTVDYDCYKGREAPLC